MENNMENFNNNNVFISNNSFKQNKIIKKDLRFDVNSYINFSNLVCIGGESYLFGLTNNIVTYINHYTNSIHIYNDAIKNNKIYRKNLNNNNINYNTFNNISSGDLLLINIAKLNIDINTLPTQVDLANLRVGDVYRDTTASNVLKVKV
jgi:hypothetical protein